MYIYIYIYIYINLYITRIQTQRSRSTWPGNTILSNKSKRSRKANSSSHLLSKSLPSSSANSPAPLSGSPSMIADEPREGERRRRKRKPSALACPACTFLNHPYLRECEMCGTPLSSVEDLPKPISDVSSEQGTGPYYLASKSAPTSRPVSPSISGSAATDVDERERFIKLSFRKGGDKAFYASLKTALQQKEWEVCHFFPPNRRSVHSCILFLG